MCNPALLLGAQGVSGGLSAIGAYGQAASQKSSLNYDARVADMNSVLVERQAQIAMEQGQFQVDQLRRLTAGLKGSQRATMAARGLDLTAGTPAEILTGIAQRLGGRSRGLAGMQLGLTPTSKF